MHANAQLTFSALHSPRPPAQGTALSTRKRVFPHQLTSQGNQSLLGLPNPDNPTDVPRVLYLSRDSRSWLTALTTTSVCTDPIWKDTEGSSMDSDSGEQNAADLTSRATITTPSQTTNLVSYLPYLPQPRGSWFLYCALS